MNFRVSAIAQFEVCPKRSKILLLHNPEPKGESSEAVKEGIRLHEQYPYIVYHFTFDRRLVKYKLGFPRIFEKKINIEGEEHTIRGVPDDIRVLFIPETKKKYVMIMELKTTTRKKYILKPAIKQLQIYMWLMKEELERIGFPLWKKGMIEVYSQKTGECIKRISVDYDENIEQWIKQAILGILGLHPVKTPSYKTCKYCSKNIKEKCDWYKLMKGEPEWKTL